MAHDEERWRQAFEAEQGRMWRALWVHGGDPELAAEVGSIVGASAGAVRVRLHRARRRLRDDLTDRSPIAAPAPEDVP